MSDERQCFTVFGFAGTHEALRAEDVLIAGDIKVALIPTPRVLGSLCGFAVRVPSDERTAALETLAEARITPDAEAEIRDRAPRRP